MVAREERRCEICGKPAVPRGRLGQVLCAEHTEIVARAIPRAPRGRKVVESWRDEANRLWVRYLVGGQERDVCYGAP